MDYQKEKNVFLRLVSDDQNWMNAFRQNIGILRAHYGWSVRTLADKANCSENTINKILQGKTSDCDHSLTIKLARAFNVSVDELTGAGTIEAETRNTIAMSRTLKEHHRYVIRLFAKHQYLMHGDVSPDHKTISVLLPECRNGHMTTTNLTEALNIDHLPPTIRGEVCMGLKIPCDHYEPNYIKDEILLLGAHREWHNNEKCLVSKDGNLYLCIKKIRIVDGKKEIKYLSVINGIELFRYEEIDDRIGYVIGFLHPDGEWGVR